MCRSIYVQGNDCRRNRVKFAITFKPIPHSIFKPFHAKDFNQNVLVLRMQPNEGMGLSLEVKSPGSKLSVNTLEMECGIGLKVIAISLDFLRQSFPCT